jgi:hypothetical protein
LLHVALVIAFIVVVTVGVVDLFHRLLLKLDGLVAVVAVLHVPGFRDSTVVGVGSCSTRVKRFLKSIVKSSLRSI